MYRKRVPAVLVVVVAVAVGVWLGVAHAGGKAGGPIQNGTPWAQVYGPNGSLVSHSTDGVRAIRSGPGQYIVVFKGSLAHCAILVTPGLSSEGLTMTALWFNGYAPGAAYVEARNAAGVLTEAGYFFVMADCAR